MSIKWTVLEIAPLTEHPIDWHVCSADLFERLKISLITFGQLRPLVVYGSVVYDGRKLLRVMRELGQREAYAIVCGEEPQPFLQLATDLSCEIDYAKLAYEVSQLLKNFPAADIAKFSRWSQLRIQQFGVLATFDWGQFRTDEDHESLWGDQS
jgi:hypothetical protein